jgi:hypothetical protein
MAETGSPFLTEVGEERDLGDGGRSSSGSCTRPRLEPQSYFPKAAHLGWDYQWARGDSDYMKLIATVSRNLMSQPLPMPGLVPVPSFSMYVSLMRRERH